MRAVAAADLFRSHACARAAGVCVTSRLTTSLSTAVSPYCLRFKARAMTSAANSAASVAPVHHDPGAHRFSTTVGEGGEACELLYLLEDGSDRKIMNITRTYTAPAARGKGVAGKLADAAFNYAREHGYAVRPTCSYISDAYLPGGKGAAADFAFDASRGLALPKLA